jgi:hypothetical protein
MVLALERQRLNSTQVHLKSCPKAIATSQRIGTLQTRLWPGLAKLYLTVAMTPEPFILRAHCPVQVDGGSNA